MEKIDDYVKHFVREHNQEADHVAILGTDGKTTITIDGKTTKAAKGLDGSKKEDGRSGCGVLIKAVDTERWITISRMAIPLKACTAMVAELTRTSVWTEVLDLLSGHKTQLGKRQRVHQQDVKRQRNQ